MDPATVSQCAPSTSTPTPTPPVRTHGTRKRQPSVRVRDTSTPVNAPAPTPQPRRIRPLAAVMPNNANTVRPLDSPSTSAMKEASKPAPKDKQLARKLSNALSIEFPPKHVVLHPDDATNKVFIAIGRAFMAVDNCAMTVKDLAELTLSTGLQCQNVSAAAQAITFFIRNHLQRCEVEQDCPLLLRHVLSGSARDDALAPALYSRAGGNVSKEKAAAKDENGKEPQPERLTCFRRGTVVWYLSKAAGAACPFARNGISLRDFTAMSAFAGPESRKKDGVSDDSCRGMKRKREREGLRRRPGRSSSKDSDEEEEEEEGRPMKVKLTLRLRPPPLSTMREQDEDGSSSSSSLSSADSDSESDDSDDDEVMSVDEAPSHRTSDFRKEERAEDASWSLPPYPIQRRISIPPYTPCEETYSGFFGPSYSYPVHSYVPSSPECSRSRPVAETATHSTYRRQPSVPLSVASPPPESDAEDDPFDFSDESTKMLDESAFAPVAVKTEDDGQTWPQDVSRKASIKSEPSDEYDFSTFDGLREADVKLEDLDFNSLSLAWNGSSTDLGGDTRLSVELGVKEEEAETKVDMSSNVWEQSEDSEPVMISPSVELQHCPFTSHALSGERGHGSALLWTDVELLGPEHVHPDEFEGDEWANPSASTCKSEEDHQLSSLISAHPGSVCSPSAQESSCLELASLSPLSDLSSVLSERSRSQSRSRSPSLSGSVQTWSSPELDRGSLEPSVSVYGPDLPSPAFSGHRDDEDMLDAVIKREREDASEDEGLTTQKATPRQKLAGEECLVPVKRNGSIKHAATRPQVATQVDIPVAECSTPWERGMISLADVEEHLLPTVHTFDLSVSKLVPTQHSRTDDAALNPLSPQEEEVFQSLFQCPVWEPNSPLPDVQLRTQSRDKTIEKLPLDQVVIEVAEGDTEGDENSAAECNLVRAPSARPLRRSLRVAKAAASKTVKERLRKRTTAP